MPLTSMTRTVHWPSRQRTSPLAALLVAHLAKVWFDRMLLHVLINALVRS